MTSGEHALLVWRCRGCGEGYILGFSGSFKEWCCADCNNISCKIFYTYGANTSHLKTHKKKAEHERILLLAQENSQILPGLRYVTSSVF